MSHKVTLTLLLALILMMGSLQNSKSDPCINYDQQAVTACQENCSALYDKSKREDQAKWAGCTQFCEEFYHACQVTDVNSNPCVQTNKKVKGANDRLCAKSTNKKRCVEGRNIGRQEACTFLQCDPCSP